ncbi:head-tail connector protein [Chelativorans intermedius]|uniref:Head-tail connector protein n=1 Tax=Chelativorans intermedius TaxID=515947 RepID=A0ABV6DC44_9HYPH|nr:head-tail connector protein [Chelativorans intermedius]MCT8999632.1 head-tail connector protein [Chelativorans intermedius]
MVDLASAKLFCRVDHDDDDAVITAAIAAATDHLESIGVDTSSSPVPPAVEQAILMLVAFFYDHRDDTEAKPQGMIDRLVSPYREGWL